MILSHCPSAVLAVATVLAFLCGVAHAGETPKKPNVIVFLTDDMGYGDLACLGNPVVKTPHWDRLHAESVRLTDFHVAPMCTPTRAALMTGRYPMRYGLQPRSFRRVIPTVSRPTSGCCHRR